MNVASSRALAVSKDEFAQMLKKCTPPTGWSRTIGIANSGGPDSTCLLFLIHRYLTDLKYESSKQNLQRVVSFTIDHDLQLSSYIMAEHCAKVAKAMGVEHITFKIPWSEPPFPLRPSPGQTLESTARVARYHLLFHAMKQSNADVLAFGHHSDDQVETSLMRLGRGSTEYGAGGMKSCRRWGMGMGQGEGSLGWAGHEGMSKWIVRPLLDVSKDRIFATCEKHDLEYITDPTNFQPHVTLRNAIRGLIANKGNTGQLQSKIDHEDSEPIPADILEKLTAIDNATSSLKSVSVDLSSGAEQLRGAVRFLTSQVEDINNQVDSSLNRCSLPTTPGTYLLSSRGIARVHNDMVRAGMVLRIMRYVSFHPWGSLRADGNRRRESIKQIIEKVWNPNPFPAGIRMFVAGGGVLWTPVVVKDGLIKTPDRIAMSGIKPGETIGWLASRQPPLHRQKMAERGLLNPLHVNITQALVQRLKELDSGEPALLEILYDCRFLVRINVGKMPERLAIELKQSGNNNNIMIYPNTRWYWPKVVREWNGMSIILHSKIAHDSSSSMVWPKQAEDPDHMKYWEAPSGGVASNWISVEWIRSLAAT